MKLQPKKNPFISNTSPNEKIGERYAIIDAVQKVTGGYQYVDDMKVNRMLFAKVLFSPYAHANILSIDTSEAEALPGVRAVLTHKNTSQVVFNSCGEDINVHQNERVLNDKARYVGDRIAAVAADTEQIAEKAISLIKVEYEELPFHIDPREARFDEENLLHEGGNIVENITMQAGDVEKALAKADQVVTNTYHTQAVSHGAIEPHATLVIPDARGKVTVYTPSQDVFGVRNNLSRIFGLKMSRVRVINPGMGGGFGGKIDAILEPVATALALATGRPVKLTFKRKEVLPSTRTRHEMYFTLKTGINRNGRIVAQDLEAVVNAGAYSAGTSSVVWAMGGKFFKSYKVDDIRFRGIPVFTSTPVGGAMRGFGSPQRSFAQQRQMQKIANMLGLDVVDLQLQNLVTPADADPRDGKSHGQARPGDCVRIGAKTFDWNLHLLRQEKSKEDRDNPIKIGAGMAVAVHGNGVFGVMPDTTGVILKMNEDGSVHLMTGVSDMGNGSVSTQAQFVAEILGLSHEEIEVISSDTDVSLWDLGNYSSRGTFVSGQAAIKAARAMRDEIRSYGAEIFGVPAEAISLGGSHVYVTDNPEQKVKMAAISAHAHQKHEKDICHAVTYASEALALSYGAHFCQVEVNTETGAVKVSDYVAVHDIGKPVNPLNVEGQIEGAIQMGLGFALSESLGVDPLTGKCKNLTLKRYGMKYAGDMPDIRIRIVGEAEESGPYGAKSLGECSTVPVAAAIANAISNALGLEFDELPITSEMILAKLKAGKEAFDIPADVPADEKIALPVH